MNMIENNNIIAKPFIIENVFALSILSAIITFMILNKTIKTFTKIFKTM